MAQNDLVYMNIPQVQGIAQTFTQISETLRAVSTALGVLIDILKGIAFIGLVASFAEAQFLEVMKRQIDQMADKTEELSKDVRAAVDAYEKGDAAGALKFH